MDPDDGFQPFEAADRVAGILDSYDYSDVIQEITHRLRRDSITMVDGVKRWAKSDTDPLLNEIGIEDVATLLSGVAHRIVALSSMPNESRVFHIMGDIGDALIYNLFTKHTEYEVKSPGDMLIIYEAIMGSVEFSLRQAVAGHASQFVRGVMSEQIQTIENQTSGA